MTDIFTIKALADWQLLKGSHEFPGPSGGTCINEAAIVVAGFPYRSVGSFDDCPPCFSRPLANYLLFLNDRMPDYARQALLPFAVKLSGSADAPDIEQHRVEFIAVETVRRVLSIALDEVGLTNLAEECRAVQSLEEARKAAAEARGVDAPWAAWAAWAAEAAARAAEARAAEARAAEARADAAWAVWLLDAAARAAEARAAAAEAAAKAAEKAAALGLSVWPVTISIAEGAFAIGRQADPIDAAVIKQRALAARGMAPPDPRPEGAAMSAAEPARP